MADNSYYDDNDSLDMLEREESYDSEYETTTESKASHTLSGPVEVIGVRFKVGGKVYYFDPKGLTIEAGANVIIETARGQEYGQCVQGNKIVDGSLVVAPLRPVVRIATAKDEITLQYNKNREQKAFAICQDKILELGLDMKLVEVEYSFDGNKILFFFTSECRVDFRELVKNLASIFHTRIELRQIGVRDEAKMLGGLGICGRPFCCTAFLDDFHPVSIKMAKTQSLSLNPSKISGCCGRLMCCLKYEQDAYEDLQKRTPRVESYVETPQGKGVVTDVNLLRSTVKVTLDDEPDASHTYKVYELNVLHNGSRTRKSAPLLPPDPPVVFEEPETEEYPEILYTDNTTEPENTKPQEYKNRRKNGFKKKNDRQSQNANTAEQAAAEDPQTDEANTEAADKPKEQERYGNRKKPYYNKKHWNGDKAGKKTDKADKADKTDKADKAPKQPKPGSKPADNAGGKPGDKPADKSVDKSGDKPKSKNRNYGYYHHKKKNPTEQQGS